MTPTSSDVKRAEEIVNQKDECSHQKGIEFPSQEDCPIGKNPPRERGTCQGFEEWWLYSPCFIHRIATALAEQRERDARIVDNAHNILDRRHLKAFGESGPPCQCKEIATTIRGQK